jgi:hypothetical protein
VVEERAALYQNITVYEIGESKKPYCLPERKSFPFPEFSALIRRAENSGIDYGCAVL